MCAVTLYDPVSGKICKVELHDGRIRIPEVLTFFQAVLVLWKDKEGFFCILGNQTVNEKSLSQRRFKPGQVLEIEFIPRPPQIVEPATGFCWKDKDGFLCILGNQIVNDKSLSQRRFKPGQVLEIDFIPRPPQIEEYKYEDTYVTVHGKTFVRGTRMNKNTLESEISLWALLNLIPGAKRVKLVSKDGDYEIEIDEDHSKEYYPYISYPGVGTKENPWFLVRVHGECSSRFDFLKHIFPSWSNKSYKKRM